MFVLGLRREWICLNIACGEWIREGGREGEILLPWCELNAGQGFVGCVGRSQLLLGDATNVNICNFGGWFEGWWGAGFALLSAMILELPHPPPKCQHTPPVCMLLRVIIHELPHPPPKCQMHSDLHAYEGRET